MPKPACVKPSGMVYGIINATTMTIHEFTARGRNGTILDLASLNGIVGLRDLLKKHDLTGAAKRFHPTTTPETMDAGIAALL